MRIEQTTGLGIPHIPEETKNVFRQHLLSYNNWALTGQCTFIGRLYFNWPKVFHAFSVLLLFFHSVHFREALLCKKSGNMNLQTEFGLSDMSSY